MKHYHVKKRNINNIAKNIKESWPRTSKKLGQNLAKTLKESSKFLAKFFKVLGQVFDFLPTKFPIFIQMIRTNKMFFEDANFPGSPLHLTLGISLGSANKGIHILLGDERVYTNEMRERENDGMRHGTTDARTNVAKDKQKRNLPALFWFACDFAFHLS